MPSNKPPALQSHISPNWHHHVTFLWFYYVPAKCARTVI